LAPLARHAAVKQKVSLAAASTSKTSCGAVGGSFGARLQAAACSAFMEAEDCCPICVEDMDVTDKNFRPCKCGYQICLFCYRHIKDDLNGLCPACRTPYDEANATFVTPDPQE